MWTEVCPYPCQNKTEYGYCKTSGCINPKFDRTRTFTFYDPIEIARKYAPKFDKPVVDMVEVVRCKDCKWYLDSNEKCGLIDTRLQFYTTDKRWTENSYCSWGERKDEAEE